MSRPTEPTPIRRSAAACAAVRDWSGYFDAVSDAGPRQTLVEAADHFAAEGIIDPDDPPLAVDLGCGTGRDTIELLKRGWRVLAIDGEQEGLDRMLARPELTPFRVSPRLEACVALFQDVTLPPCSLVSSSYTLPFCPPDLFDDLWRRIVAAIPVGGRFAGQLFGEQDDWATLPDRTHHTRAQVDVMLSAFEVESLRTELYGPEPDAVHPKRWHIFHVVARKRR
jgi:SAM-dependent methyltransferase